MTQTNQQNNIEDLNRVVSIMTYQSSASCLISSLLDSHPNLLGTPDDVLCEFQDFWKENNHLKKEKLIKKFISEYAILFDAKKKSRGNTYSGDVLGLTTMGPDKNECLYVDTDSFEKYIKELIRNTDPVPRKLFFQAIHIAYTKAIGRKVENPIIVFGLHNTNSLDRLKALMEDFPNICFLMMVRHPLRSVASRFRWQNRMGTDVLRGFGRAVITAAKSGVSHEYTYHDNWRAVKMEDLHFKPELTLKNICDWIDIPWDDILLKSTFNGKMWWNLVGAIQVSGFSPSIASQKFEEYLPIFDRIRLNILLSAKCNAWGYTVPSWCESIISKICILPFLIFPFKMEFMSLPSIKNNFSNNEKNIIGRIISSLWEVVSGFGRVRIALIQAWLLMFKRNRREVKLL